MLNNVFIALLLLVSLSIVGCNNVNGNQDSKSFSNHIIQNIRYVKDNRTNICFAFYQIATGPALAAVPCENIPSEMLAVSSLYVNK